MKKERKNKEEHIPGKMGSWKSFLYLITHGKIAWMFVIVGEIVALASGSVALQFSNKMSDVISGDFSMETLYGFIWMMALYAIFTGVSNIVMMIAQAKSVKNIRTQLWKKLIRMPYSHPLAQKSEQMLSTISADAASSMSHIIMCIIGIPSALYFIFLAAMQASSMSNRFLIPIFCLIPLYIVYAIVLGKFNSSTNIKVQTSIGVLTGFLSERLRNLDLIKAYNNQKQEEISGTEAAEKLYKENCKIKVINAITTFYVLAFDTISVIMAVLFGSSMIKSGTLRPVEWANFFVLLPMINNMMRSATGMWVNAKGALGYTARIAMVLEAPEENMNGEPVDKLGDIVLNNVSFTYGSKMAVDNVSFTIPFGKKTAIVGPSGSGKTTLLNLLERFYIPQNGSITVDGRDVNSLSLSDYRSNIAYVQQDAGMFSGTVRESVLYGIKRDVSDDEIIRSLACVGILDYVNAHDGGLDAKIAMWGTSLSGGQKQKLVIARELLKNSPILLLDEPTSSLDLSTQKSVYDAIKRAFSDKTLITVTHDLNLISEADQIVVMNNGKVIDSGKHDDLMERCALYRDLVNEKAYEEVYQA